MEKELLTHIAGDITVSQDPGATLRKWREIFGISQSELAEFLKVTPSTISDYEGGRRKSPGIAVIKRFVEALMHIDKTRGGKIIKQLGKDTNTESPFHTKEFFSVLSGKDFLEAIEAEVIVNESRLKDTHIYGYSLIDSLRAILDVPVHDYLKLYGKTPERALIFMRVESGRSPMIAVRVGRFSTEMKPAIVVLHGVDHVDPLAIKIAKVEKIPLLVTKMPIEQIKEVLKKFE